MGTEAGCSEYIERKLEQTLEEGKMVKSGSRKGLGTGKRRGSYGNIEEMLKRKRGDEDEEGKKKGEDRAVKRTGRTPDRLRGEGEKDMRGFMERWKKELEDMMENFTGLKGWREEFKQMREEIREGMSEQIGRLREEMEDLREELKERKVRWKGKKEEMKGCIKGLVKRVEELEVGRKGERGEGGGDAGEGEKGWERRVKGIEWKLEKREREERRRNVLIRGLGVTNGKRKEAVQEMLKEIGAEVKVEEVVKMGGDVEKGREMVVAKLKLEGQKREVLDKKRMLRGRKEMIMEDRTWRERRMRWKLVEIAREEEGRRRRVWVGYGRIKIDDRWWRWDEEV